jgi:hypothetical protein
MEMLDEDPSVSNFTEEQSMADSDWVASVMDEEDIEILKPQKAWRYERERPLVPVFASPVIRKFLAEGNDSRKSRPRASVDLFSPSKPERITLEGPFLPHQTYERIARRRRKVIASDVITAKKNRKATVTVPTPEKRALQTAQNSPSVSSERELFGSLISPARSDLPKKRSAPLSPMIDTPKPSKKRALEPLSSSENKATRAHVTSGPASDLAARIAQLKAKAMSALKGVS